MVEKTDPQSVAGSPPAVAVIELFTSEGCSSCPPADRLLADLTEQELQHGKILTLSFHVDYWDHLGFKDPFSLADSSARQRWYASHLRPGGSYTPQMVVSGKHAFVGSKRRLALRAVKQALSEPVRTVVQLDVERRGDFTSVAYTNKPTDPTDTLEDVGMLLALVQSSASVPVTAGENNGERLIHRNVVRAFKLERSTTGSWALPKVSPLHTTDARFSVVALAQPRMGSRVLGATSVSLSGEEYR